MVHAPTAGELAPPTSSMLVRSKHARREALVHIEDVMALVARATAGVSCGDVGFYDPAAERLLSELELGDFTFDSPTRSRAVVLSTFAIDEIVREFFTHNPDGVGIGLQPGLCSRFCRVDNGCLQWVDMDPPALAELKCSVMRTPARHMIAASCGLSCRGWMDAVDSAHDAPILLVHQGAMKSAEQLPNLFDQLARRAPRGLQYVADYDVRAPLLGTTGRYPGLRLVTADGTAHHYPRAKIVPPSAPVRTLLSELPTSSSVVHLSFI